MPTVMLGTMASRWKAKRPVLLDVRCSTAFTTFAVSMAVLVDMSTYSLIVPIVPFRLAALGYGDIPSKVSYLVASYGLGLIASSLPVAVISDRFKSRRTLLVGGLVFLMAALVLFWRSSTYPVMIVARVFQGISGTIVWTLGLALICDQVPAERRGSAMGFVLLCFSIGATLGPAVGGALYAKSGYNAPFIFALLLASVDVVLRLLIIEKAEAEKWRAQAAAAQPEGGDVAGPAQKGPLGPAGQPVPPAWRAIVRMVQTPRALTSLAMIALFGFFSGGVLDTAQTIMLNDRYGLDSEGAGLVFLGAVIPSFLSSPLAGYLTDKLGPTLPCVVSLVFGGATFALTTIRTSLPVYIVFLALAGFFLAATNPPVMTDLALLVDAIPGLGFGAIYACFNGSFSLGATVGPFISGAILNAKGPEGGWRIAVALCAALCIAMAPFGALFLGEQGKVERIRRRWRARREWGKGKGKGESEGEGEGEGEDGVELQQRQPDSEGDVLA